MFFLVLAQRANEQKKEVTRAGKDEKQAGIPAFEIRPN